VKKNDAQKEAQSIVALRSGVAQKVEGIINYKECKVAMATQEDSREGMGRYGIKEDSAPGGGISSEAD